MMGNVRELLIAAVEAVEDAGLEPLDIGAELTITVGCMTLTVRTTGDPVMGTGASITEVAEDFELALRWRRAEASCSDELLALAQELDNTP